MSPFKKKAAQPERLVGVSKDFFEYEERERRREQRWAEAKEAFLANGDTNQLRFAASTYLGGNPYFTLVDGVVVTSIEISELIVKRAEVTAAKRCQGCGMPEAYCADDRTLS